MRSDDSGTLECSGSTALQRLDEQPLQKEHWHKGFQADIMATADLTPSCRAEFDA